MEFQECPVQGAYVVSPAPHVDGRGRFERAWCAGEFTAQGIDFRPVQANRGGSIRTGTLRGLHYQVAPALEAKLVRCARGALFDVVVDLRPGSPTFLRWHGVELGAEDGLMLYVPEGCAHGCLTLEDNTEFYYLASAFYAPDCAKGLRYDDPSVGIAWPRAVAVISDRDRTWPLLEIPG